MYEWTKDMDYITDSRFTNFYDRTLDEYIERWQLQPDSIMLRKRHMNVPENFDANNSFHTCRGLASYVENFPGLTVGVDLIASLYAGFEAHATMEDITGDRKGARRDRKKAAQYQELLDEKWWDADSSYYQTFWTEEKKFYCGEGIPFLLWFGAVGQPERARASVADILSKDWNVENLSAFPALLYRLGYMEEAYGVLNRLPDVDRSDYPEVSFGVLEGLVCGLMGIAPSAKTNSVTTCLKSTDNKLVAEIDSLPVFKGYIKVRHSGSETSFMENRTGEDIVWNVSFMGDVAKVRANGREYRTVKKTDVKGNTISSASIPLPDGSGMTAEALR